MAGVTALALSACGGTSTDSPSSDSANSAASSSESTASTQWSQAPLPTQPMNDADASALDNAVTQALAEGLDGAPGAWVGVWLPDKGVHVAAYGKATDSADATIEDHNYIGSLTKTATATAVLQLVDQGTIALTDTVADLDPALAEKFPPIADITLKDLLTMNSGLPDYGNEPKGVIGMVANDPTSTFSAEDLIRIGLEANEIRPVGTPGYSTTNYIILGEVLAAVTGKTPEELVTGVFAQVGMTQSALLTPGDPRPAPASDGHLGVLGAIAVVQFGGPQLSETTNVTDWTMSWGRAGGGAYSTITDLGLWGASGLGNTLLSQSLGDARLTDTVETPDAGPYGYGIIDYGNGWYGHSGQVIGWEAEVRDNPETGAVIAVMVNSTESLGDITSAVIQAVGLAE